MLSFEERIDRIQKAGKNDLLERVRNNIIDVMKPNSLDHWDSTQREFRHYMFEYIQSLKGTTIDGIGKIIGYPRVFNSGNNSVVFSLLNENLEKYVFKSGYYGEKQNYLDIEAEALRRWHQQGVITPKVIKSGETSFKSGYINYIILEFIKPSFVLTPINTERVFAELGKYIPLMHKAYGIGFGDIEIRNGEYIGKHDTYHISPLLDGPIKDLLLLQSTLSETDWDLLVEWSLDTINNSFKRGEKQAWLHRDLGVANIMCTDPITIIDPKAYIGHPYEDIANIVIRFTGHKGATEEEKKPVLNALLLSYEQGRNMEIDQNILDACIVVRGIAEANEKGMRGGHINHDFLQNIANHFERIYKNYL